MRNCGQVQTCVGRPTCASRPYVDLPPAAGARAARGPGSGAARPLASAGGLVAHVHRRGRLARARAARVVRARPHAKSDGVGFVHPYALEVVGRGAQVTTAQPAVDPRVELLDRRAHAELCREPLPRAGRGALPAAQAAWELPSVCSRRQPSRTEHNNRVGG